jgi:uncharacterized protein (DUF2164 family)
MAIHPYELDKEAKDAARVRLASYLRSERDEEWGDLAVMLLVDVIEEQIGPLYYNLGVESAQKAMREMTETFDVNLEALKRLPPAPSGR